MEVDAAGFTQGLCLALMHIMVSREVEVDNDKVISG